jgi:hypothetical protein
MTSGKKEDRRILQRGWDYEATIPYQVPDSLEDLHGPAAGTVRVGPPINTGLRQEWGLSSRDEVRWLYAATIRDGSVRDQQRILNPQLLMRLWPGLNLPTRCRAFWEAKFPRLGCRSSA